MKKMMLPLALLLVSVAGLLSIGSTSAAQSDEPRCFPVAAGGTGYCIKGDFRRYWEGMGGLTVFGYPISAPGKELNPADGAYYTTQWFERHRMEYHPELASDPNYYILLGLLGNELSRQSTSTATTPSASLQGSCRSVESGQVCGRFRAYWDRFGLNFGPNETYRNSLALHGKPVSPVMATQIGGKTYQVQWFERARFEWHGPGSVDNRPIGFGTYDVEFGLLGNAMRPKNLTSHTTLPYSDQQAIALASDSRVSLDFDATAPVDMQESSDAALLLVPPRAPPDVAPDAVMAQPSLLANVIFGGLRAGADLPGIPAGAYAVALSADGQKMRLEGVGDAVVELPAVIRSLPQPYQTAITTLAAVPEQVAQRIGFNRQVCYGWGHIQICGLLAIAVGANDRAAMSDGFSVLGLGADQADQSQTLPIVAGADALDLCVRALSSSPPDYRNCGSVVLAAPASGPQALRPADPGADLGVVVAQAAVGEQVYSDPGMVSLVATLPAGAYVAESLVFADDQRVGNGGSYSRVRLSGPAGTFYMPAIVGVSAVGDPLSANLRGTSPSTIAAGTSLLMRDTCFFKVSQCPVDFSDIRHPIPLPPPPPPPPPVTQTTPAPTGSDFGIDSNIASRHPVYETLQAPVDAVAGLGVGWAREDFQFARIEPSPGVFDWNWHDRVADLLGQRNVQIIGLLNRPTPGWANGQRAENVPPDPQTFAAFAGAVVTRYKDRVHYWQVWNEPDNPFYWGPQPDPAAYAALLKATYAAIKAADPSAQVLAGGLVSPEPALSFLSQIQANGAWGSFDIIALNPYTDPLSPEQGQIDALGIGAVRGMANAFGAKPIWVTEFGWSTGRSNRTEAGVDEATQANYLVRGMALLRAAGAERVLWYNLKDADTANYNLYGVVRYDSSRASYDAGLFKTAYNFFHVLNQQLAGTSGAALLDPRPPRSVIDFEQPISWRVGDQPNGTLTQSSAQVHSGASAAQLSYTFPSGANDYVVFTAGTRIPLPDGASKLGIWVYGDGSAHALKVWLRDSQGEVLQFRLGPTGGAGWHFIAAGLGEQVASYNVISGEQNRLVDFPASLVAIVLDDEPDSASGAGTIYLDDMTASVGAESYGVRFTRGGEVIDVIWAPQVTQIALATSSAQVTRVRAWGETSVEPAANGQYTFTVGPDPVYIHHVPR